MKKSILVTFIIIFLFASCSSWKEAMIANGDQDVAIKNAVLDFLHSVKLSKKNDVFFVYIKSIDNDILGVSIAPEVNKVLVVTEDSVIYRYAAFPTNYIEQDGKLFYWDDSARRVNDDLIATLTRYNHIDTAVANVYIPDRVIDDSKKAAHYYFCRNDLTKYKRVITNIGIGYYAWPKLECTH